jgi:hypothetical protein
MNFLLDYIAAFVGFAFAIVIGLFLMGRRVIGYSEMRAMQSSKYVIFEAYPIHLGHLVSDMKDGGWRLVSSTPASEETNHYRFEKAYSSAKKLGNIIYKKDGMPLTSNRRDGADLLVKIADHGKL